MKPVGGNFLMEKNRVAPLFSETSNFDVQVELANSG